MTRTVHDCVLGCALLALVQLSGCGTAAGEQPAAAQPSASAGPANATAAACGAKDQPDCPTQRWMKATLQTYVRAADYARLESALHELAAAAPAGYPGWSESSQKAALAAAAQDMAAVKAQCIACHDQHRKRFRTERRNVPLPL